MHLLSVLLSLLSVDELQALDVILETLDLQFARLFALGDRFFLVNDLQMQLYKKQWCPYSACKQIVWCLFTSRLHQNVWTYAVVLAREVGILLAQR